MFHNHIYIHFIYSPKRLIRHEYIEEITIFALLPQHLKDFSGTDGFFVACLQRKN